MIKGNIRQFETMGLVDGPGVRLVIFFQGCPLRCIFCHNPEMRTYDEGTAYTPTEVLDMVLKYKNYFGEEGGVTFSGGEPLAQSAFLAECLKLCKEAGINTCIITSGVGDEGNYDGVLEHTDLILFSLKEMTDEKFIQMTEKASDKSLSFLKLCQEKNKKLWIRNVIIPGINDTYTYIEEIANFIRPLQNIEKVELLPYHTMALSKYDMLNLGYGLKEVKAMNDEKCQTLQNELDRLLDFCTKN